MPPPHTVVAAGHAAAYALHQCVYRPGLIERLILIAPTWRGPLPTIVGGERPWFARLRAAFDHPLAGPWLYRLNVSRLVIAKMAREHVYSAPDWLAGERLAAKRAVTRVRDARHGSVRFVTGALDRVDSRAAFLDLARRADVPKLTIYGEQTPARSQAEMAALAELPSIRAERLDRGKLAIHEEFPDTIAPIIQRFLGDRRRSAGQ